MEGPVHAAVPDAGALTARRRRTAFRRAAVAGLLALTLAVAAAGPPAPVAAAQAPDAALARREGTVTLYTTIAERDLAPIIRPFEARYGIEVQVWRAGTDKVLQRSVAEYAAGRHDVDVIHFGSPEMEALAREKVLQPVDSPTHRDLQPGSVPPHRQWAATMLSVWVQAYNTRLIRREELPRTYRDLLQPKWKGKLGVEGKNQDWFAAVVEVNGGGETGLRFFRDLMATNGLSVRQGHSLLTNLVVSGEVPLALSVYSYMPEQARKKGAPIDWFVIEPAIARSNAVGIARRAPHPHAARLLYEYLLTDAQAHLAGLNYVPTNTRVPSPLKGVRIKQTNPAQSLDESQRWMALFESTVHRRARR